MAVPDNVDDAPLLDRLAYAIAVMRDGDPRRAAYPLTRRRHAKAARATLATLRRILPD